MKRRSFLQLGAVAGTAAVTSRGLSVLPALRAPHDPLGFATETSPAPSAIQVLKNEFLEVTIFSDATATITDRKNGADWCMGPVAFQEDSPIDVGAVWVRNERSVCEEYPGRFLGRREGDALRFSLLDRLHAVRGTFTVNVSLAGPWLEFRITDIQDSLPSLSFPAPIESETLVLPQGVGRWIRQPVSGRHFLPYFSRLNMRWFGGTKGEHAWIAVLPEKDFVDSGAIVAEMSVFPVWQKSLERWTGPRVVRYTFLRGSYVELAKTYREWAVANRLHRSLTEKAAAVPALNNLLNGRLLSFFSAEARHEPSYREDLLQSPAGDALIGTTPKVYFRHTDIQKIIGDLPDAGISSALIVDRGWIRGGYDYSHPDIWPPDPALGAISELGALCAQADPYTVGLHDNYQDIYAHNPSFPKGVNINVKGELLAGGYWAGGQAYILNPRDGLSYAQRNWGKIKSLQPRAMFIDTTSAVQCYESFDVANTSTRSQDVQNKQELLRFFKSQGVVLGSEEGADFAIPFLDWVENRHARVPGESVPIWPLVFHDAVASGRYVSDEPDSASWMGGAVGGGGYPQSLVDMLWGYFLLTSVKDVPSWREQKQGLKKTVHVDDWFRSVSTAAMTGHKFLSSDSVVEQTWFSNGHSIIVNFSGVPWKNDGVEVPPRSYRILG